jgi:GAF domain-containing protein
VTYQAVVDELLAATGASRCTLRLDVPGDYPFPAVHEALAPGAGSLLDFRELPQLAGPTFHKLLRDGKLVVMDDCAAAVDGGDPDYTRERDYFVRLMELYGGMAAFIAVPVIVRGEVRGVVSLHQLGAPREWSPADVRAAEEAGGRASALAAADERLA